MTANDTKPQQAVNNRYDYQKCLTRFVPELYAYSISPTGVTKKLYIYPPNLSQFHLNERVTLNDKQSEVLALAISSSSFAALDSERFTLYDISLRESIDSRQVAFSFIDIRDGEYTTAQEVLNLIHGFDTRPLVSASQRMERCVFDNPPTFNPTWMFGLLFNGCRLTAAKAYIRFDPENTLTSQRRRNIISDITKAHGASDDLNEKVLGDAETLEDYGFVFRFIGIDCETDGLLRYKLYFRSDGDEDCIALKQWLLGTLTNPVDRARVEEMFTKHNSGMWGIGLSLGNFDGITGFQPYFLP